MNLLEKIRQAVENLAALTLDQLNELKSDILKCRDEYPGDTPEDVVALTTLADAADAVNARVSEIEAESEQARADAQAARDRLNALEPAGDGEPADGAQTTDAEGATEGATDPALEPVAASSLRPTPSTTRRPAVSPELSNQRPAGLVAAGQLIGKSFGESFSGREELAREMASMLSGMDPRASHGRLVIARSTWKDSYSEDRRLKVGDESANLAKVTKVFEAMAKTKGRSALAASGGVPLPTNIDYGLDTWASASRPIRDALASFNVDRGGLLFRQPPTLAALAGATAVWTNANDIDPTDPTTKPVIQIDPQGTTQEFIDAVPTRLGFGNLMGQFDPETIAANTDLAIAAAARVAELNLLRRISGYATAITSAQVLGASRDLVRTVGQVAAAYRFNYRLDRNLVLQAIFPSWLLDLFKLDRAYEFAHDGQSVDPLSIPDSYIEEVLGNLGIEPIWAMDGVGANSVTNPNYVAQTFGAFTTNSAMPAWPTEVVWWLFIKGSVQFLDGGRLDLGVVRDSTLDATNDYETFVETFEGTANRGFAGSVLECVSTVKLTGGSSAGVTVS